MKNKEMFYLIKSIFRNITSIICLFFIVILVIRHEFTSIEIDVKTHLEDLKYIILASLIYLSNEISENSKNRQN
jgi:hypothetical protein